MPTKDLEGNRARVARYKARKAKEGVKAVSVFLDAETLAALDGSRPAGTARGRRIEAALGRLRGIVDLAGPAAIEQFRPHMPRLLKIRENEDMRAGWLREYVSTLAKLQPGDDLVLACGGKELDAVSMLVLEEIIDATMSAARETL